MYDENSFKNYIFWLQVKRVFLMVVFSIVGAFIGILLSQFFIDVLLVLASSFKPVIIAISTLLFFCISLLLTAGTGKEVQDGYWKMAVLRKLTVISKKLDYLENLDNTPVRKKEIVKKVAKEINSEIKKEPEMEQLSIEDNEILSNNNLNETNLEKLKEEIYEKRDFAGNLVSSSTNSKKEKPKKNNKKNASKKTNSSKITKLAKNK